MSLYVSGYGHVSNEELAVRTVCRKHDNDLVFRRSERTGNFTIFQRMQRDSVYVKRWEEADLEDGNLFPIKQYGGQRLPSVDEVEKWLWEHDQNRKDLLSEIDKRNAKRQAAIDQTFQEESREMATILEHGLRKLGNDTGVMLSTANDGKRRRTPKIPD